MAGRPNFVILEVDFVIHKNVKCISGNIVIVRLKITSLNALAIIFDLKHYDSEPRVNVHIKDVAERVVVKAKSGKSNGLFYHNYHNL